MPEPPYAAIALVASLASFNRSLLTNAESLEYLDALVATQQWLTAQGVPEPTNLDLEIRTTLITTATVTYLTRSGGNAVAVQDVTSLVILVGGKRFLIRPEINLADGAPCITVMQICGLGAVRLTESTLLLT